MHAAVWTVGDGNVIRPFVDPWIPGRFDRRLGIHPLTEVQTNTRLVEWIDVPTRQWKEHTVRAQVSDEEAATILKVPIPLAQRDDALCWSFERGGKISVRSAYHLIREENNSSSIEVEGTGDTSTQSLWAAIWKATTIPKIKVFTWKLAKR